MGRGKCTGEFMLLNYLQPKPKDTCFNYILQGTDRRIFALKNNLMEALTA